MATELARESWRDDGVPSSARSAPAGSSDADHRSQEAQPAHRSERADDDVPIPDGSAALMNLHWAAYGVLAEQFKDATDADAVQGACSGRTAPSTPRCRWSRRRAARARSPSPSGRSKSTPPSTPRARSRTPRCRRTGSRSSRSARQRADRAARAAGRRGRGAVRRRQPRRQARRRPLAAGQARQARAGGHLHRRLGARRSRRQRRGHPAHRHLSPARRGAGQSAASPACATTSAASASRRSPAASRT